jgi:hemolysin activation/secretion protein
VRYDLSGQDLAGPANLGVGLSVNAWYSGSTTFSSSSTNQPADLHGLANLQGITGSKESSGYWVILTPSFSQDFLVRTNWPLNFRLNGQWASEPLISSEQFGVGGVSSVRGYHEGEVFGDGGVFTSLEQKTPVAVLGMVHGNLPLGVRASIYTDFGTAFLLDPHGRPGNTPLWGTGAGAAITVGPNWEARLLFSVPLLSAGTVRAYQPLFNFALDAQF